MAWRLPVGPRPSLPQDAEPGSSGRGRRAVRQALSSGDALRTGSCQPLYRALSPQPPLSGQWSALDSRHTNVALEARKLSYDPVLFGYTDAAPDPRILATGDPSLLSYEGVLPGMTPEGYLGGHRLPWLADLKAKGYEVALGDRNEVFRPRADYPGAEGRGPTYPPARYKAEDSNTAFLTDQAIRYMSVREDKPWFVHMSYLSPHPPFVVAEPYHDMYDPADTPPVIRAANPEEEAKQHPWLAYFLRNQQGIGFTVDYTAADNLSLSESDERQLRATNYAMMSEVDANIGRRRR